MRVPLSVLLPVKNEAADLRECLASIAFADEIVVVDSVSTDGTQEIAVAADVRVVQFEWNGKFSRKKNWALENIPWRHDWVLIIDADERVTPALEKQIRDAIQRGLPRVCLLPVTGVVRAHDRFEGTRNSGQNVRVQKLAVVLNRRRLVILAFQFRRLNI